jgi:hypothetical protein
MSAFLKIFTLFNINYLLIACSLNNTVNQIKNWSIIKYKPNWS